MPCKARPCQKSSFFRVPDSPRRHQLLVAQLCQGMKWLVKNKGLEIRQTGSQPWLCHLDVLPRARLASLSLSVPVSENGPISFW